MKRYFFDIEYEGRKTADQHGTVLADTEAAKHELLTALIETASGVFKDVENAVICGWVREDGGEVFFEGQIELRSKSVS